MNHIGMAHGTCLFDPWVMIMVNVQRSELYGVNLVCGIDSHEGILPKLLCQREDGQLSLLCLKWISMEAHMGMMGNTWYETRQ